MDQELISSRYSSCCSCYPFLLLLLFLDGAISSEKPRPMFHRLKSDRGEIWQECSSSEYASIDGVGFSIWHHASKMAAMASLHADKCWQIMRIWQKKSTEIKRRKRVQLSMKTASPPVREQSGLWRIFAGLNLSYFCLESPWSDAEMHLTVHGQKVNCYSHKVWQYTGIRIRQI